MMEYKSWDLVQRESQLHIPEETLNSFHMRCSSQNSAFFLNNTAIHNAPFIIFHPKNSELDKKTTMAAQGKMKLNDLMYELGIPPQKELLTFYENYMQGRFSSMNGFRPRDIVFLGHKLFVIQYDQFILHATDGLSFHLLAMPLFPQSSQYPITYCQIIMRIYRSPAEKYETVLSALSDIQEFLQQEIKEMTVAQ